jgi:hypothetical protein
VASGCEQLTHPAQQRRRITAYPDVPVGQQDRHPPARAGYPSEHIPQNSQRPGRLRDFDRVRRDVDAQRRDPALGERHRQPARPGTHVECGPVTAVDQ